jgi:hypothetical protein
VRPSREPERHAGGSSRTSQPRGPP